MKSAAQAQRYLLDGHNSGGGRIHGGLSLYGMGRFPVTLYEQQWLRILASAAEIETFIRENDSKLKAKE
jgi:hypothetical protein